MHILEHAYIYPVKARLNIAIDEHLLAEVKKYAQKDDTSVSELAAHFFLNYLKPIPEKQASVVDIVDDLHPPAIKPGTDLKKLYYEERSEKCL